VVAEPNVAQGAHRVGPMSEARRIRAVSLDFGQTLASIDADLLVEKLARLDLRADKPAIDAGIATAWAAYDQAVRAGLGGHPWKLFMRTLLEAAVGSDSAGIERAVDSLWDDQPKRNLWRHPLPDMIELVKELRAGGVRYAILSNSEGRLAELIEEIGLAELFPIVADSGKLGIEKPDRRIFDWVANELGASPAEIVHIGDSLGADVEGALGAGMRAIWFRSKALGMAPLAKTTAIPGVPLSTSAADVRIELQRLGLPLA
jgi:HAD superfamily hydrolase (TIGR01509 family)